MTEHFLRDYPGYDCITHHCACDCREEMMRDLDKQYREYLMQWTKVYDAAKLGMTDTKAMMEICRIDIKVNTLRAQLGFESEESENEHIERN